MRYGKVPLSEILSPVKTELYADPEWNDPMRPLMPNWDDEFYTYVDSLASSPLDNYGKSYSGSGYKVRGDLVIMHNAVLLVSSKWPLSPTYIASSDNIVLRGNLSNSGVMAFRVDTQKANPWYVAFQISKLEKQYDEKCDPAGVLSKNAFLSFAIDLPPLEDQVEFLNSILSPSMSYKECLPAVDFLGQFSKADCLKFLTHGFEPPYKDDYFLYVTRCRTELGRVKNQIPTSLYDLVFGFVFGPSWTDCNGDVHNVHCACKTWYDWCVANQGGHPSDAFPEEFLAFKNSIRVYNGTMDEYFTDLKEGGRFRNVQLHIHPDVEKFDSYMDVRQFRTIVTTFLDDIDRYPDVAEHPIVSVKTKRLEKGSILLRDPIPEGVKVDDIVLCQEGSYPSRDISEAMDHFVVGGGTLSKLRSLAAGHFVLFLETTWAGKPIRWNLSEKSQMDALESISPADVSGYKLIIRILHRG